MKCFPEVYKDLDLSSHEKSFMRCLSDAYRKQDNIYYVLDINPLGKKSEKLNLFLSPNGIICFKFLDLSPEAINVILTNHSAFLYDAELIKEKLEYDSFLCQDRSLKYKFTYILCFPTVSKMIFLSTGADSETQNFASKHCMFADDFDECKRNVDSLLISYLDCSQLTSKNQLMLEEEAVNKIFARLCPYYTIPQGFHMDCKDNIKGLDGDITKGDRSIEAFRLETEQVNIVNRISRGHQLILACAGSGKSVLLISKCFRLAALNPDKKFLICCRYKNISSYYKWLISVAGYSNKNVDCFTFLELCRNLLLSNNLSLPLDAVDENFFDRLFIKANDALVANKISQRYYGIFIDEIQCFEPEWYKFSYNLLMSHQEDSYYFVIAGDKSQDMAKSIKRGTAPWQTNDDNYPKYYGKKIAIEKNYRNSIEINEFINDLVDVSKNTAEEMGIDLSSDPELFLRGKAFLPGEKPYVKDIKENRNSSEVDAIMNSIRYFIGVKKYNELDIAVVLYNKKGYRFGNWFDKVYNIGDELVARLTQEGLDFSIMKGENRVRYSAREGITLFSIIGALGLDFKAVILAGLRPLGKHEEMMLRTDLIGLEGDALEKKKDDFKDNIKQLYTACTRAKSSLHIILSASDEESIYCEILRKAGKRQC